MATKGDSKAKTKIVMCGTKKEFEELRSFLTEAYPNGYSIPPGKLGHWRKWKRKLDIALR